MWRKAFLLVLGVSACNSGGDSASLEGCVTLAGGGQLAAVQAAQVEIEAKLVLIDRTSMTDLGISFPLATPVQFDNGSLGNKRFQTDDDVAATGETVGGLGSVSYLVTDGADGLRPFIKVGFVDPFAGEDVEVLPQAPFECTELLTGVTTSVQNLAPGTDTTPLAPFNAGLAGQMRFDLLDSAQLAALLAQIAGDARNKIIAAPKMTSFDNQTSMFLLKDVNPMVGDLTSAFQSAVQAVTPAPISIDTGVTIFFTPTIVNGNVQMKVRLGSEAVTYDRSVPGLFGVLPADFKVPQVRLSTNFVQVTVPAQRTLALGDLLRQGQTETEKGIPVLGDIPVVGALFKKHTNDQQNLIIFVTATIINNP